MWASQSSVKTALQLQMALQWLEIRGSELIKDLENGVLYHGLTNEVSSQLPILQSSNVDSFWGNENSSVSTVLLYSIASSLGCSIKHSELIGVGAFYPFFNADYVIEGIPDNPFIFKNGMVLFGDYQFGGHRYFSNEYPNLGQRILAPEDCSSAVGKATNLTEKQVVGIYTGALRNAYTSKENEYGYQPITSSLPDEELHFELVIPGDIYVRGGHTAIVSSRDNFGNIQALEFNRDIDVSENKKMGGGVYQYNLPNMSQEQPVYILRKNEPALKEVISLSGLVEQIDTNYYQFYEHTKTDMAGDCGMFFDTY